LKRLWVPIFVKKIALLRFSGNGRHAVFDLDKPEMALQELLRLAEKT
jgi:hypothetical protein